MLSRRPGRPPLPSGSAGGWHTLGAATLWLLGLLIWSCSSEPEMVPVEPGEPGTARLIVAGRELTVELAADDPTRTRGLMYRTELAPDRGMLFLFPDTAPRRFWMHNTLIALDIVFLDEEGLVINIEEAPPAVEQPGFHSRRPARFVLEVNRGWSAEHGLLPGQQIVIDPALRELARP